MASLRSSATKMSSKASTVVKKQRRTKKPKKESTKIVDEIDLDLYGPEPDEEEDEEEEEEDKDVDMRAPDAHSDVPMGDIDMEDIQSKAQASMANPEGQSLQATHWCLIYRSDGALEVRGRAYGYPPMGMFTFSRTRYGSTSRY